MNTFLCKTQMAAYIEKNESATKVEHIKDLVTKLLGAEHCGHVKSHGFRAMPSKVNIVVLSNERMKELERNLEN